jgi:hypothetical protein
MELRELRVARTLPEPNWLLLEKKKVFVVPLVLLLAGRADPKNAANRKTHEKAVCTFRTGR